MLASWRHRGVLALKSLLYAGRGEPYSVGGHTLYYTPGTRPVRLKYMSSTNMNSRYDALQVALLAKGICEGDTAIDIGAHAGQYAILMSALCGSNGRVIAFEPDPYAREHLRKNLGLNPSLKSPDIEAKAVSDTNGEMVLLSYGGDSQSSLSHSGLGSADGKTLQELSVETVRLDDYLRDAGNITPQWVKIDAEGAEIRILKGAQTLLEGPANVICELHPYAWQGFGNTFDELRSVVSSSGRRMRYLDQQTELSGTPVYGTVILERC